MSYLPTPSEGSFERAPAGTYTAICYRVVDLGTQQSSYNGQTKHQRKVMLSWELHDDEIKMSDGRPFSITQRYTWSMSDKATLRQHLEAWRGMPFKDSDFGPGGFNIKNVLGKACLLQVVHDERNGKTYDNIQALMKLPKGVEAPALVNEQVYFWLDTELFDRDVLAKMSDNLQATIKASPEYAHVSSGARQTEPDDGIPAFHDDPVPF